MPIFKLSAAKTMRRLSVLIFLRSASNFARSDLDLKHFRCKKTPNPAYKGEEGRGKGRGGDQRVPTSRGRRGDGREKGWAEGQKGTGQERDGEGRGILLQCFRG